MELLNFVGGEFVSAESKKTFSKFSPFDGSLLAEVAASDAMDVIKALQVAKKAATSFKDSTKEQRSEYLQALAKTLQENADQIAYEEALHQGLPHSFVLEKSVQASIEILKATAQNLLQPLEPATQIQPSGIVGIITPWSCSIRLVIERLAPALAAGNAVIAKISEHSPITVKVLGESIIKANLPVGVVSLLQGNGDVGQIIGGHPSIRAVTAAGRTSTIEAIAKTALTQFKKVQLSGGAKNPSAVLADADYKNLLPEILRPFLIGQGQMCWNISRLFVLESFAKEFVEELKSYLSNLKPLKDPRGSEVWTPLISKEAVTYTHTKVQEGAGEHGKIISGGAAKEPGFFYQPTAMLDLSNCSVLQQDEVHGPLLIVTPVKYQHEIQKWANTSYLAHSAVLWGSWEKATKVASALDTAEVWINSWMLGSGTIFGHKQSSYGNLDMSWNGSFYSDVKKLAGF